MKRYGCTHERSVHGCSEQFELSHAHYAHRQTHTHILAYSADSPTQSDQVWVRVWAELGNHKSLKFFKVSRLNIATRLNTELTHRHSQPDKAVTMLNKREHNQRDNNIGLS